MAKTAKKGDKPAEKKLPQKKTRVRNQVKKGPHGGTLVVLVDDTPHVGKQGGGHSHGDALVTIEVYPR